MPYELYKVSPGDSPVAARGASQLGHNVLHVGCRGLQAQVLHENADGFPRQEPCP